MLTSDSARDDLSLVCCQHPDCLDFGKCNHDNLSVWARYGQHHRRLLYCQTCKARFSERQGTPLLDGRLPESKVLDIWHHSAEGCGLRPTGRLGGVKKATVVR